MTDTLGKVRPGQPLRIPAAAYNAFIDAAKTMRGVAQDTARDAARETTGQTTPIKNTTAAIVERFGVLGVDGPLFPPGMNDEPFKRRVALAGSTPSESLHPGKFAIALEPIAPNAIGIACASGLCIARVEFPAMGHDSLHFADITDGTTAHLTATIDGSARIIWQEPVPIGGGVIWALIRLGDSARDALFVVKLEQVGGEQGTAVTPATWTYNVTDTRTPLADPIALAVDPTMAPSVWARPDTGQVEPATAGLAYTDENGELALAWINEVFAGGGSGDFQAVFVVAVRLNNVVTPAPVVGPMIQISYDLATTPGGPAAFVNVSPSGDRSMRHTIAAIIGAVGAAKIALNELQEPIVSALILPEDDPQKVLLANDDEPAWPVATPWVGNAGSIFHDPLRLERINNVDGTVTIKLITQETLVALKRLKPGETGADQNPSDPFTDKIIIAAATSPDEVERSSITITPGEGLSSVALNSASTAQSVTIGDFLSSVSITAGALVFPRKRLSASVQIQDNIASITFGVSDLGQVAIPLKVGD